MADRPNPFLKLMQQAAKPAVTPQVEEKKSSESVNEGLTKPLTSDTVISAGNERKETNTVLTPQALRLLGTPSEQGEARPAQGSALSATSTLDALDSLKQPDADAIIPSGLQELASINTDSMEPQDRRETNLNVEAARLGKKIQLESASDVRALCDRLDAKLEAEGGANLAGPNLFEVRNYVQTLMVTLKTRPEFDEVIIAKDVHNVMKFIRATREEALAMREIKTEKKATRAANKEVKGIKQSALQQAFKDIMQIPDFSKLNGGK